MARTITKEAVMKRFRVWRGVLLSSLVCVLLLALVSPGLAQTTELTRWAIPSPGSLPYGIGLGQDKKVYFAQFGASKIGQLDPVTDEIRERSVGDAPFGLYVSPDGSLFYTMPQAIVSQIQRGPPLATDVLPLGPLTWSP